ncbi:pentatricopeptide repeat-containing protein At4g39952, mitochondrial [Mangifera indica]|uniref:pentatricopeptide repeat-containing protein At4g39952, mitochondrial n=1 Tax=Mangifera indica TaxID=29780 RepID=UPI001CFBD3F5|nr:pentatricopeptide repeat-containing protein At4g39952, mitochondrial [Mangifera indica]
MLKLLKNFRVSAYSTSSSLLNYFYSHPPQTLHSLLQYHALIITSANSDNIFIASKLISFYASFNKPHFSTQVFSLVSAKADTFLWNSIIKCHFSNANYRQALQFFHSMRLSNTPVNDFTIPMVVSACAELNWKCYGDYIHGVTLKCGLFEKNSAVGSSLVYMYAKCGCVEHACVVFDDIVERDVVAWTALVIGYVQNGESARGLECLFEMIRVGGDSEKPNFRTIEGGFQACGNLGVLSEGRCLHGYSVKTGLGNCQVVQSSVLAMYSKCGDTKEAYFSFSEVAKKDLFSWTSIIGVCARFALITECLTMFWEMQVGGLYPDGIVISCMLLGFGNSMYVSEGKAFHGLILRRNYVLDQMVQSALLSMYCKFGLVTQAEKFFKTESDWNREAWNTMVIGYGKAGMEAKCIQLSREMQHLGIKFDSNSLVSVISSCSQLGAIYLGRSLHCYMIKNFEDESISVFNALIDMYGKNSNLTIAWRLFCRAQKDVVAWNTMISAYTHRGHAADAVALFDLMISENVKPNAATLVSVVSACSQLASLEKGQRIHQFIKETGFELNLSLYTALVDMYAKCGQLETSRELFNSMKERDAISWNVMISGYGTHGDAKSAIEIFQQMEKSNVKPNTLTFLALLLACTHAGLVEQGKYLFDRMQNYSVKPNLKHYACMVDLLGRSGNLQEAEALVMSMPIPPDGGVWGAMLSACKLHNEIEMGVRMAKLAIESEPENDGYYIMICNMYSSVGKWVEAEGVRKMMKERHIGKRAGWSVL